MLSVVLPSLLLVALAALLPAGHALVSFSAVTGTASWEPRIVPGLFFTTSAITYTPVGGSSTSLPSGSLILYGGETEGPSNPNNGSGTINVPSQPDSPHTHTAHYGRPHSHYWSLGSCTRSLLVAKSLTSSVACCAVSCEQWAMCGARRTVRRGF